jgi:C4-dicarboxylate transporter/malic acid transport protein
MSFTKHFGTNWFTTVMGIGIVSILTYTSPLELPWQHQIGSILFSLLNAVFLISLSLWSLRWILHTDCALDDFRHPSRAIFYGALAMAINIVGNAYLLIGTHLFPVAQALVISKSLWVIGVGVSCFSVITIPFFLFVKHEVKPEDALASWLIPVVPPIVAAACGVNLLPYAGSLQQAMTFFIIALFGITFFLFIMISGLVFFRLVYHSRLSGQTAPSLWVEIGPIGMAMSVVCGLTFQTGSLGSLAPLLRPIALLFAGSLWGVGWWWIIMSSLYTLLHLRKSGGGISFDLGWWSYVFPIGSFTNGTYALEKLTGSSFFTVASTVQLSILWVCFIVVIWNTVLGIINGNLFKGKIPLPENRYLPTQHKLA